MQTRAILTGLVLYSFILLLDTLEAKEHDEKDAKSKEQIQRGQVLVFSGGCNDCHSPKIFTPEGTFPDHTRLLSGHPADLKLPEIPPGITGPDKWLGLFIKDQTAWAGPWGVSFAINLTPDPKTGIGNWTEDIFIITMRAGRHKGLGRNILPPMPWEDYAQLSDEDLKAIFAYLRTLKPIVNQVPSPIPQTDENIPAKP
ncbi:MAG: c-type cytochrome [Thermodesulfobacteriota bacterium]